jgi:hypothetical protein
MALLIAEGFHRVGTSCKFTRWAKTFTNDESHENRFIERVWLHKNGGQADVYFNEEGRTVCRLESWKSIDDLRRFFRTQVNDLYSRQ